MTKRWDILTLSLALACTAIFAVGCNKSSSNPTGTGSGGGGSFSDLVGFWYTASDSSGIEIRSDSTVHELIVNTTGHLVYSPDTLGSSIKITKAASGQIAGTVKILIPGVVDTTLPFAGTYSLSADKNTLNSTLTGPFGTGGQVTTMTQTSVRSSLNAQVLTGGGGGGGTGSGSAGFSSDKGNFAASGPYNPNAVSGSGATAIVSGAGSASQMEILAYRINSATNVDLLIITLHSNATIATGTYSFAYGNQYATISYSPGINPSDTSTTGNLYLLTSGAGVTISTLTSSNVQGTFGGTGFYFSHGTVNTSQTINVTGGTFNVPVGAGVAGSPKIVTLLKSYAGRILRSRNQQ